MKKALAQTSHFSFRTPSLLSLGASFALVALIATNTEARPTIKRSFFDVYPWAEGGPLDTLTSNADHCGICHVDFEGGGARTPYGLALEPFDLNKRQGREAAINAAATGDQDGDGFLTILEMDEDGLYANTPTFPGWAASNYTGALNVDTAELALYLKPATTIDTDPPTVEVTAPNGGSPDLTANSPTTVTWTADDPSGIAAIHIYLSLDDGATYTAVELGLPHTGSYTWLPANRPSTTARIQVVAVDGFANVGSDESDAAFTIVSPAGGTAPTTLRDFDMPGSQPFEGGPETGTPGDCAACHGNYDAAVEPYRNWLGSMMAHASNDPLFLANMAIANQDAPESGDLCLRCHNSRGWLQGRSTPTDGSRMTAEDQIGVSCDLCHRMVDPDYKPGISPERDQVVLAALESFPFPGDAEYGNGMLVLDTSGIQRGPFADAAAPHNFIASPFHSESAFCGTCHDVSNPAFYKDAGGVYQPNTFDAAATGFSPHSMAPVERTYSEWLNSTFATTGVHDPDMAGNKADGIVSSCQDCHMRDVDGKGCNLGSAPTRPNLPHHDMTGGSTWMLPLIAGLHSEPVDQATIDSGVARARYMLQHAAELEVEPSSPEDPDYLTVTVTNKTGHKLPTGYPEGRRVWVNVKFYDSGDSLVSESCAYDPGTGVLTKDAEAKIYEVKPGIGPDLAATLNTVNGWMPGDPDYIEPGPSFHFVLNNAVYKDNRIPPLGFTNAAFEAFGGAPVGTTYADGQNYDETHYTIPAEAVRAEVTLFYQSTSKEFIDFLVAENDDPSPNASTEMYDLWVANDRCPPEEMESDNASWTWTTPSITFAGIESATPGIESATLGWSAATSSNPPVTYSVYHSTTSGGQDFGSPPLLSTPSDTGIVVSPLDPGSASQLTHYFVVRASDAGASESNTAELSVQPLLDPAKDQDGDGMTNSYETAHSLDPFDAADALQDPDDDGLTTLEECAYGSDPNSASSAHRPQPTQVDVGGTIYFALSYIRSRDPGTPTVTAEVSSDLITWTPDTAGYSVTDNLDGTETVVVRMLTPMSGSPHDFMRLRVTAN